MAANNIYKQLSEAELQPIHIPLEIIDEILFTCTLDDPRFQWTTLREVSKRYKSRIEATWNLPNTLPRYGNSVARLTYLNSLSSEQILLFAKIRNIRITYVGIQTLIINQCFSLEEIFGPRGKFDIKLGKIMK